MDPLVPPDPHITPLVVCPACRHSIDSHGVCVTGRCNIPGPNFAPCPCLWKPNEIAYHWMVQRAIREERITLRQRLRSWWNNAPGV